MGHCRNGRMSVPSFVRSPDGPSCRMKPEAGWGTPQRSARPRTQAGAWPTPKASPTPARHSLLQVRPSSKLHRLGEPPGNLTLTGLFWEAVNDSVCLSNDLKRSTATDPSPCCHMPGDPSLLPSLPRAGGAPSAHPSQRRLQILGADPAAQGLGCPCCSAPQPVWACSLPRFTLLSSGRDPGTGCVAAGVPHVTPGQGARGRGASDSPPGVGAPRACQTPSPNTCGENARGNLLAQSCVSLDF